MLVVALVHSRIDYGNGMLVGNLSVFNAPTPVSPERGGADDLSSQTF